MQCMLMDVVTSCNLSCVRNPSEVKLQRQEELHVALCLLHVVSVATSEPEMAVSCCLRLIAGRCAMVGN